MKLSKKDLIMIIGALGYFILPCDVLPDAIPGIGLTDDAAAISIVVGIVGRALSKGLYDEADELLSKWFD